MDDSAFFSVHQIQLADRTVSAAFLSPTAQVFREDGAPATASLGGHDYVPWGADDHMPYDIIDLIESDETLSTCQIFNAEMCYGSGLEFDSSEASPAVAEAVESFVDDNDIPSYFLGTAQDIKHFNFAVSLIVLSRDRSRIVELHRKEACYCRFAPKDASGHIPYILYADFRNPLPDAAPEKITLLDPRAPLRDLRRRVADGRAEGKYAVLTRFPGPDSLYYPIPHYAALFRGSWFNIKRLIGVAKQSKLENAASVKYVIEVSNRFWESQFLRHNLVSRKDRERFVAKRKAEMIRFLTDIENTDAVLFTDKAVSVDGKGEFPDIKIVPIDAKTKQGGDWESDIAEAVNMVCFTMRVHSNLVGSVPGKAQSNNSGSDKRELFTIAHVLQKPYRDILFKVHRLVIAFNGWKSVRPVCRFIQLSTLDTHSDAKSVQL